MQIRVGINAWPGYEFIYLAQEKGYYKAAGLDVRLVEFNSLTDARRAFERGQIDALGTTVVEVMQARSNSPRDARIIQVMDYSNGADVILSHPDITEMAALKGKKVGVEVGSLGIYVLVRALEMSGLQLTDIVLVSRDQLSMQQDFIDGNIDAVVTYPLVSIALLRDDQAKQLFSTAQIPGEVVDVIAADGDLIESHPLAMRKFLSAIDQAIDFAAKNPSEAYPIMAAREGISADEFKLALTDGIKVLSQADQHDYFKPDGHLIKVVNATDKVLRQSKQITGPDRKNGVIDADIRELKPEQ